MNINSKYEKIIEIICKYKGIKKDELINLLKIKKYKYMMLLFIKKYKCDNLEKIKLDVDIRNKKYINKGYKKAEEKLFINKEFRDIYFELEDVVEKNIK